MKAFRILVAVGVLLAAATMLFLFTRDETSRNEGSSTVAAPARDTQVVVKPLDIERQPTVQAPDTEPAGVLEKFLVLESGTETPIADAQVFLDSGSQVRWLGSTDAEGRLTAFLDESATFVFRVSESTHAPEIIQSTGTLSGETIVHLAPGGVLRGTVRDVNGRSVGFGARVAAWPVGDSLRRADIEAWLSQAQTAGAFAITDELGEFSLNGLISSQAYLLCAGHRGTLSSIQVGTPSADPVDITVLPMYGLIARIRSQQSSIPEQTLPASGIIIGTNAGSNGKTIDANDPRLLLSGFSMDGLQLRDRYDQIYLTSTATSERELLPIRITGRIPGYEQVRQELHLSPCEQGLQEYSIILVPSTKEWCNLTVQFAGAQIPVAPAPPSASLLALFILTDVAGESYEYHLQDFNTPLRLPGIPCGSYSYQLKLMSGFLAGGATQGSVILDASDEEITFDVGNLAEAQLSITTSNGSPFVGRARVKVTRKLDGQSTIMSFERFPYVLRGLPGDTTYIVEVVGPKPGEGKKHSVAEFHASRTQLPMVIIELDGR